MSDELVNAGAMVYGAGKLGGEMFRSPAAPEVPEPPPKIPLQIEGPKGHYAVDPTGQVVDLDQLTEAEKRELFRGPKEYIPREKYVRPARATPPIIGGEPEPIQLTPEQIERIRERGRQPIVPAFQAAGEAKQGGQVSFGAEAAGGAVPSARQTAVQPTEFTAGTGAAQPADLIQDVTQAVMSKDRTGLREMREKISGEQEQAPGVGTVSQANDVLRLIDARLQELRSSRIDPELERIRRVIVGRQPINIPTEVTVLPEERAQLPAPRTKQLGEGQKLLPAPPAEPTTERPSDASSKPQATEVHEAVPPQPKPGEQAVPAEESSRGVQPSAEGSPQGQAPREVLLKSGEQPIKLSFPQFLTAAREGTLLDYLRRLPKREPSEAETAARQKYEDAAAKVDKAGLSWIYDRANPNKRSTIESAIRGLSKAKKKIVDAYEDALEQNVKTSASGKEGQKNLYDRAIAAGLIEKPTSGNVNKVSGLPQEQVDEMAHFSTIDQRRIYGYSVTDKIAEQSAKILDKPESRGARGGNLSTFGVFDPANYRPAIEFGKELAGKISDFAKWSAQMIEKFGESIRDKLDDIWGFIKSGIDEAKGAAARVQSVLDMSGDDFAKFSAREGNRGLTEKAYELGHEARDVAALDEAKEKATQQARDAKEKFMRADPADKPKMLNDMAALAGKRQYFDEAAKMARALDRVKNGEPVEEVARDIGVGEKALREFSENEPIEQRGPTGGNLSSFGLFDPAAWDRARKAIRTTFKSVPTRYQMDQALDAADNLANIDGQQQGNAVRKAVPKVKPEEDIAASAIVAANFDRTRLPQLLAKAIAGGNREAEAGVRLAMSNWARIEPIARRGHEIMDEQQLQENNAGINTQYREGYLPGVYDMDLWMGTRRPYMIAGSRGGGIASGFKKGKSYASPFDAIEAGYTPRSLKLSDLVEHRVRAGQRLINRVNWGDALRTFTDPTDGKSLVTSLTRRARGVGQPGYETAPIGYVPREIIPGVRVAVHEGYARLFDSLLGRSQIEDFEVKGLPVGKLGLEAHGGIKHGLLLFDSFHASRILQKELFLSGRPGGFYEAASDVVKGVTGGRIDPKLVAKGAGYKKGATLLEYTDRDLNQALADGDITREMADYARANRPKAELLIKNGLNVGRVQEALYTQAVRNLPVIGRLNKWIFEKLTRGAMMESAVIEFDRIKDNNPTWSDEQVARTVSRDLNKYFGNLGRQGVFKSKTMQDLTRLAFLAPQWVESVVRSELGGAKQLALDPLLKRKLQVGSLGVGMGRGLVMYLLATQIGNLITTGLWKGKPQPTWENEDKGHKLDMWVPDFTGKTRGYYISPLGVVAETTHDLMKSMKSEPDILSAAGKMLSNKASPEWRAGRVLLEGRDWSQNEVAGVWNKAKAAALDLLPVPIPASSIIKGGAPGSTQRLIMQSLGAKAEPAGSARNDVMERARAWGLHSSSQKIQRHFSMRFPPSEYAPLKQAITGNDREKIIKEVRTLLADQPDTEAKEKRMDYILKNFEPFVIDEKEEGGGHIKAFATRSKEIEDQFLKSLDSEGRRQYFEAVREQVRDYRRLTQALYGQTMNPPIPDQYENQFSR